MTPEQFFELFLKELENTPELRSYYKVLNNPKSFAFRKAHFLQRLQFVNRVIQNKSDKIWDVGCGYATTAIFLALNGYRVYGSTLEFYFKEIEKRLKYWSQFGDLSSFKYGYENLFDMKIKPGSYDIIIVQDTLHHLEPLADAIGIFNKVLSENGRIVVSEVNGNNIFERLKFYKQRGNKRIIEIYDEKLQKNILFGNENVRPMNVWEKEFSKQHFAIDKSSLQYIRLFPPQFIKNENFDRVLEREQSLWRKNNLLKEYFFFGVNFVAVKN
jgi:2-polyprenyl-3-methyl-5-hydroxy-6-metoxy-1,4-benzoquinol methylase